MGAGLLPAVQEVPAGGSAQERRRTAERRRGPRRATQGTAAVSVVPHERRRPGRAGQDARGRAGNSRPLHVLHRHEERVEAEVQEQVRPGLILARCLRPESRSRGEGREGSGRGGGVSIAPFPLGGFCFIVLQMTSPEMPAILFHHIQ